MAISRRYNFLFRYPLSISFYFFLFFIIGVASAFYIKNVYYIPHLLIGTICIVILSIMAVFIFNYKNDLVIVFIISIASLVLGYTYTSVKYYNRFEYSLLKYEKDTETIEGFRAEVLSYHGLNLNRHVYIVNVNALHDGDNWHNYNSKIRLYSYNDNMLGIGDTITSTANIKLYKDIFTNGTKENAEILSMLEKNSLVGVATSYNYHNIIVIDRGYSIINYMDKYFTPLRMFIKKSLAKYMTSVNYSVAQCLLIGDKYILPYSLQEVFQKIGISHILAVSGLHLSIVYFILFSLLSILPIRFHFRLIIASVVILVVYLPITLYLLPILRASIMMIVATISLLFDRTKNILNILLLTAFIITVSEPDVINEISFQFSFLATFSLIIYMPMFTKLIMPLHNILKIIISFFAVSILANIILLPLISAYFSTITLTSVIANIYAVPITFAIIVVDIVIVVLYFIYPPLASLPASLNNTLVDMMIVFSKWLGDKNILRYEYSMSFDIALILTIFIIIISLILNYLFHKNFFDKLIKSG